MEVFDLKSVRTSTGTVYGNLGEARRMWLQIQKA
jgi:hypothetical protein